MKVVVLREAGYDEAMLGLSLSYLQPVKNMHKVALKLIPKGEPHCKFLRQVHVWVKITGPWKWWKHLQTYNVGVDWPDFQSSSTMHKLLSRPLTQENFEDEIHYQVLNVVNSFIHFGNLEKATDHLPGAFLYTRVLCFNYSALRNIVKQRKNHKLQAWQDFIDQLVPQLEHPEWVTKETSSLSE